MKWLSWILLSRFCSFFFSLTFFLLNATHRVPWTFYSVFFFIFVGDKNFHIPQQMNFKWYHHFFRNKISIESQPKMMIRSILFKRKILFIYQERLALKLFPFYRFMDNPLNSKVLVHTRLASYEQFVTYWNKPELKR